MVLLLASLTFAAPECDDLKRDMMALEIFLKDKEGSLQSNLPMTESAPYTLVGLLFFIANKEKNKLLKKL